MANSRRCSLICWKKGLVYRKNAVVNWDPVDMTVLANEQVENGRGWRSGALVERRELTQWFFKISTCPKSFCQSLDGLEDWPAKVRLMQENWIGKSIAVCNLALNVPTAKNRFRLYHPPRHADGRVFRGHFARPPNRQAAWRPKTQRSQHLLRNAAKVARQKKPSKPARSWALTLGIKVKHPLNPDWELPVWIANFILMDYGTGAIFACPAHDQRDLDFCRKIRSAVIDTFFCLDNGDAPVAKEAFVPPKPTKYAWVDQLCRLTEATGEEAINATVDFRRAARLGRRRHQIPPARLGPEPPALLGLPDPCCALPDLRRGS